MRPVVLALLLAACTADAGDDSQADDDDPTPDAAGDQVCTGAPYESCADTTSWTDCADGMECRFFMGQGFTICTPSCDATTPCPDDENGNPVDCNQMGRCRSDAPSSCSLP